MSYPGQNVSGVNITTGITPQKVGGLTAAQTEALTKLNALSSFGNLHSSGYAAVAVCEAARRG